MVVEVRIAIKQGGHGQSELLRCLLVKAGIPLEKIAEKQEKGRRSLSVFPGSLREARAIGEAVHALRLKDISLSLVPLKDSDWKTRWKKYFKPFNITRDIRIIPVWAKAESAPGAIEGIRLDTTSAFGTGLHATTQMMALLIREDRGRIRDFLDIGTGSGILSLIACHYGAKEITAIDNDKEAVATARLNFRRNKCPDSRLSVADFNEFRPGRRFDFVAANLFTEDLVRYRHKLASLVKPGGHLAVSGIFHENYPSFRRRFKSPYVRVDRIIRRKKWYAVLFQRKEA
jgi:ribosomal protein L11 methyltransferase